MALCDRERGKVYLVGAGPGDVALLTLRGKELLGRADVVVYDFLANEDLLEFCSERAELIYVGKQGGGSSTPQDEINRILIRKAKEGALVVRLKGGDPFIFGRGGEEAEALAEAGIPFEIVPGVSSAVAAPAYAGIPLTHRRLASSVSIITGHEDPSKRGSRLRWDRLANASDTLVFLMGVKSLEKIVFELLRNGRDSRTPSALIEWGTTPRQRTLTAPLDRISQEARREGIRPPAVLVIGDVVSLRERLKWFEARPLFGRRVLVTRSREQASGLSAFLRSLGAEPLELPTIEIRDPRDWTSADQAIDGLESYDWVLFTSPNGVSRFLGRLKVRGRDIRDLKGKRLGCIGPATARILEQKDVRVDLVPREYRAEGLLEALSQEGVKGRRFLLPRAQDARDILPQGLRRQGGHVDVVPIYRTSRPRRKMSILETLEGERPIDAVTFTSSSTVRNFFDLLGLERGRELLLGAVVACIGPITAKTVQDFGISPNVVAETYTLEGLVQALISHFQGRNEERRPR